MEQSLKQLMMPQLDLAGEQLEGGQSTQKIFFRELSLFQMIQESFLEGGFNNTPDEVEDLERQAVLYPKRPQKKKSCWEAVCCLCPCLVAMYSTKTSTPQQQIKASEQARQYE